MLFSNERVCDAQAPMYDHGTVYLVQFDKGSLLLEQHNNHGVGPIYLKLTEPSRIAQHCSDPHVRELLRERLAHESPVQRPRQSIVTIGRLSHVPQLIESLRPLEFCYQEVLKDGALRCQSTLVSVGEALGAVETFRVLHRT